MIASPLRKYNALLVRATDSPYVLIRAVGRVAAETRRSMSPQWTEIERAVCSGPVSDACIFRFLCAATKGALPTKYSPPREGESAMGSARRELD